MGSPRIATRVSFRALAYRPVAHIMAFKALNQAYAAKLTRENKSIRHLTDNYHGTINAEQVKSAAKAGQAHVWSRGVARWFIDFYLRAFHRVGRPSRGRIQLRWPLRKLHRWDSHPLERQLSIAAQAPSLHRSSRRTRFFDSGLCGPCLRMSSV